jgi:hypothetical protein
VPVCLAASHIAYGSIRMEPVFMVLGQSAAIAAVQAIAQGVDVQRIDPAQLQARLLQDGQVLDFESPPAAAKVSLTKEKLGGIVVDDEEAVLTGFGSTGTTASPFVAHSYRHDGNEDQGAQTARFQPEIPKTGTYKVSIAYTALANRATNVPVLVHHAGGSETITVNQRKKPPVDGVLLPLGTFRFEKGKAGFVEIGNKGTDGHVIVDAVQWLPADAASKAD